jgi:branched-chain amino acid transport system substrate-binding protein
MKALPTDDPLFGKGHILANGRKIHDVYVFQVKAPEESKSHWDLYNLSATIPGDQAFLTLAQSGCAVQ